MNRRLLTALWTGLAITGCVQLHSVSTTSVPMHRDQPIEATAYRFLFFLVNTNNNYVDTLVEDLAKQCPEGRVEGVLTKHEGITYFPLVAHAVQVTATGYCVPRPAQRTAPATVAPPAAEPAPTVEPAPTEEAAPAVEVVPGPNP